MASGLAAIPGSCGVVSLSHCVRLTLFAVTFRRLLSHTESAIRKLEADTAKEIAALTAPTVSTAGADSSADRNAAVARLTSQLERK